MQGPAQTQNYMIAGFAIIIGTIIIYALSLQYRLRNAKRNIRSLEEIIKNILE